MQLAHDAAICCGFSELRTRHVFFYAEPSDPLKEYAIRVIAGRLGVDPERIANNPSLFNDIGADSLDVVELTMEVEEEFDLP
jgi:acyl carrier protein